MTNEERTIIKEAVDAEVRARTRPDLEARCRGCGVEYDTYTVGCRTCMYRRHAQKRKSYRPRSMVCARCGGPHDQRTTGCKTCRERLRARKRRAA